MPGFHMHRHIFSLYVYRFKFLIIFAVAVVSFSSSLQLLCAIVLFLLKNICDSGSCSPHCHNNDDGGDADVDDNFLSLIQTRR